MPTPVRFYIQVAQKWGNVDPDDYQAIENWFLTEFPKLPKKDLKAILDELIKYSNEASIKPERLIYPADVPFPLMKDTIPASGYTWMNYYKQLVNYLGNLIKAGNRKKQA